MLSLWDAMDALICFCTVSENADPFKREGVAIREHQALLYEQV